MSEYFSNKIDFIIMIVLALLVAFIIGFNILQLIDSKLSSVIINVPPSSNYSIPPIYLNIEKDSNIKQIKLNDVISTLSTQPEMIPESDLDIKGLETDMTCDYKNDNLNEKKENFGNLRDYPFEYDDNRKHLISTISVDEPRVIKETTQNNATNPNYNTVNNIPLLIFPDVDVPNKAGLDAKGYYASRVKLIENQDSPLMKLAKSNNDNINKVVSKCTLADLNKIPNVNGTFDGYNAFVDLRSDSYANITSIGKSMLSPYTSYPVPS
jgi:hypothetical protein